MLMSHSIEEVYIDALKTQMKQWMHTESPEHVKEVMKVFMFNEKLCVEITRVALLMCDDRKKLQKYIEMLIVNVHSLMKENGIIASATWDALVENLRYGGDDSNPGEVWIDMKQERQETPIDRLPVVVQFFDNNAKWTLSPITRENWVGMELLNLVPFKYWKKLLWRIENRRGSGEWVQIYNNSEGRPMEEVMHALARIQTTALNDLHDDATTVLSFFLETFKNFTPDKRQTDAGSVSAIHLLDTLKMLHLSDV